MSCNTPCVPVAQSSSALQSADSTLYHCESHLNVWKPVKKIKKACYSALQPCGLSNKLFFSFALLCLVLFCSTLGYGISFSVEPLRCPTRAEYGWIAMQLGIIFYEYIFIFQEHDCNDWTLRPRHLDAWEPYLKLFALLQLLLKYSVIGTLGYTVSTF